MIDYLLKFPSKAVAEQFGIANGFASLDKESGKVVSALTSDSHSLCEIGGHKGDGNYWILFRDLVGIPIPEGGDKFIYWSSTSGDPRPTDDPNVPNIFWADGSILPNNDPPLPAKPLTKEQIADFKAKIAAQEKKKLKIV